MDQVHAGSFTDSNPDVTDHVGQRCTLNLLRAETSLRWCGVVVRREGACSAEWYRYQIVACLVTSSSPVPPKTHRVVQRCTLNLSRAETSSRWWGLVVRRRVCQLNCRPRHLTMVQNYVVRRQKPSCS
ncbi:uncharacterized protein TNCV_4078961 [Trichonephila clavipes]|nr:uncharacterized protein TNCV_4078961 [Trichonephila clavipes]